MQYDYSRDARLARFWFDSLQDMQRWLEQTPRQWRRDSSVSKPASRDWDLRAGWQGALALAKSGDMDGAQQIRDMLASHARTLPPHTAPVPDVAHAVAGWHVDVPHYLTGQPDCMYGPTDCPDTGTAPVITLAVSINATADIDAPEMRRYGMALAHKVAALEADGWRVEIIGCFVSKVSGQRVAVSWRVKSADRDIDLPSLAFSIGHPATFRRLGFACRERTPLVHVREDDAYGYSTPARIADLLIDGQREAPGYPVAILNGMNRADSLAPDIASAINNVGASVDAAIELAWADAAGEAAAAAQGF